MTNPADLHVEARDRDIIVTMPGTNLRVVYRKPDRAPQLVARLDYLQNQQEFLTLAWKLANDKARELGWIM